MEIPVLVVTHNSQVHLRDWLTSVHSLARPSEVTVYPYIVDDASWDGTVGIIWGAVRDGVVHSDNVVWLTENTGFNRAQNRAFRGLGTRASVAYVATLNHDATADREWLRNLHTVASNTAEENRVGMWGGPILRPDCHERISSAGHTFRSRDGAFFDVDWNRPRNAGCAASEQDNFVPFSPCFAAALWSLEMMKEAGLPDNDQFLYYDDVDLAYRARLAQWEAQFVRSALAYHPLPNSKRPSQFVRGCQTAGRLMMVSRYFPEPQRSGMLDNLTAEERAVYRSMDETRLRPLGSDTDRRRVFDRWRDKYVPASSAV